MKIKLESKGAWNDFGDFELDERIIKGLKEFNLIKMSDNYYIEINKVEEVFELIKLSNELIKDRPGNNYLELTDWDGPTITVIKNTSF